MKEFFSPPMGKGSLSLDNPNLLYIVFSIVRNSSIRHLDRVPVPDDIGICESSSKLVGLFKMVIGI